MSRCFINFSIVQLFDTLLAHYGPQHWWPCQSGVRWEIITIFVIDAYTRRVAERHLGLDGSVHYDILQKTFMDALPPDTAIYNEYHALIVALCKESCHKSGCGEICSKIIKNYLFV